MASAEQTEPPAPLRCEKCNKDFKTMRNYRTHQVQFHIGLCCYICGKNFSNLYKLEMHKKIHDEPEGQDQSKAPKSVWQVGSDEEEQQQLLLQRQGSNGKDIAILSELEPKKQKKRKYKRKKNAESMLDSSGEPVTDSSIDGTSGHFLINSSGDQEGGGGKNETGKTQGSTLLRKGKPVVAQAREIASNVIEYFRREAECGDILLPTSNWMKRAAIATGLSVNLLLHIRKEKEATGTFTTPGTKRPRECKITNLPHYEKKRIKEEMQRLLSEGIPVTVDRIMPFARENTSFRGGRTSLWRVMKQVTRRKHGKDGKSKKSDPEDDEEMKDTEEVPPEQMEILPDVSKSGATGSNSDADSPSAASKQDLQKQGVAVEEEDQDSTFSQAPEEAKCFQTTEDAKIFPPEDTKIFHISTEGNPTLHPASEESIGLHPEDSATFHAEETATHMPLASAEALLMLTQQNSEQQRPQQNAVQQRTSHPSILPISSSSMMQQITVPNTVMSAQQMPQNAAVVSRPAMVPTLMNFNPHTNTMTSMGTHAHMPTHVNLMGMQASHGAMGQAQDPITIQLNLPALHIPGVPQGYAAPHPQHWRKDISRGKE